MAGEKFYTQIPPSSTGNRIELRHSAEIPYTNRVGEFSIDEHVHLGTSGIDCHVQMISELTSTTGYIRVHYDEAAVFNNTAPVPGESIFDHHGNLIAQVATSTATYDLYTNVNVITSFDNSSNGLSVDTTGSANIRFSEGLPQLDAFGKLRVAGATLLGEYVFSNSILPLSFSTSKLGAGNATWDPNSRAVILSTSTASGDRVLHTTNTYHHYVPGSSQLFMATLALGDTGKAGLSRRWGYFDITNGLMFQQVNGTLSVNIRSNATGSTVNTTINQADWNKDRLDGTGPSKFNLDVTKDNLYWIDVQWLGAGRVRFGVYGDGQRIVCHEYYHGNNYPYPLSAIGSLPVCFAQSNSAATGSSSEMRAFCAAVWSETTFSMNSLGRGALQSVSKTTGTANDVYEYMATLAPTLTLPNGQTNRSLYFPTEVEVLAFDTVTGEKGLVEVEIVAGAVLSNLTWVPSQSSDTVEVDTTGTWYGDGAPLVKLFVEGHDSEDVTNYYNNMQYGAIKNYAENGGTVSQNISYVTNSSTATVVLDATAAILREGALVTITGVVGMTELNDNSYYLKLTSINTAELYTDSALTIPVDSSLFTPYTSGGTMTGSLGTRFLWSILVKKLFGSNPVKVYVKVGWKEVIQ
jgi:hypothetical protein